MSRSATTPERLLRATEELLAERAEADITVRDITGRAQANIAAVGYHFGGKDELVLASLRRALDLVTMERRNALEELPESASLEDVVRAWLEPVLVALGAPGDEPAAWRILARAFLSGSPSLRALAGEARPDVERHLLERLARHLPHLEPSELAWRHTATLGLGGFLGAGGTALLGAADGARAADRFVAYVVGALRAPAADAPAASISR